MLTVTPGYHMNIPSEDERRAQYVASADMPELQSIAFMQYSISYNHPTRGLLDAPWIVVDILHLPTGTYRRAVLNGLSAVENQSRPITIAGIRSIGRGRLLVCYQAETAVSTGSNAEATTVFVVGVDATGPDPVFGSPRALYNPSAAEIPLPADAPYSLWASSPPGIHQVSATEFVAVYAGGRYHQALGSDTRYTMDSFYRHFTVFGRQPTITGAWATGPTYTFYGVAGVTVDFQNSPLWVDEPLGLMALTGPTTDAYDAGQPHYACALTWRFDGPTIAGIARDPLPDHPRFPGDTYGDHPVVKNRVVRLATYTNAPVI